MPKHNYYIATDTLALLQSRLNQLRTDALSLILRQNSHRRETKYQNGRTIRFNRNRTEKDMSYDLSIHYSNKRDVWMGYFPKLIN